MDARVRNSAAAGEPREDRAARRVGERGESVVEATVSRHLKNLLVI